MIIPFDNRSFCKRNGYRTVNNPVNNRSFFDRNGHEPKPTERLNKRNDPGRKQTERSNERNGYGRKLKTVQGYAAVEVKRAQFILPGPQPCLSF